MICNNCGRPVSETAKFCSGCGLTMPGGNTPTAPQTYQQEPHQQHPYQQPYQQQPYQQQPYQQPYQQQPYQQPSQQQPYQQPTHQHKVVKAKIKAPAIAMMVSAGISLPFLLYGLLWVVDLPIQYESERSGKMAVQTFLILSLLAVAFCFYGALQMMNARKRGFAIAAAVITILNSPFNLIGFPIGIWALIVLLSRETKSAFTA